METLIAFAIFSLSVVAIIESFSLSSKMQARAQAASETGDILSRLLATAEARLRKPGTLSGDENGYVWTLDVEPAGDGLILVSASVTDPFGRSQSATTLRWQGELMAGQAQ